MNPNLVIELFDVWDIDFMGPFMSSHGIKCILVAGLTMFQYELKQLWSLIMKGRC